MRSFIICTLHQIKEDCSVEHVERPGEMRNSVFIGKPERKRTLGKPRSKWGDFIRTDPKEIEWEFVNWMHLSQYRD
jgi:hypothetical protein